MTRPGLAIGVIGAGGNAAPHLEACVHSGLVTRAVLADPDAAARAHLRQRFGLIKADFPDPEPLLDDPEVRLIDVCVPLSQRAEVAGQALAAGKHVVLEAPPAPTVAEARALLEYAEANHLRLMCALSHLHIPAHLKLDELRDKNPLPQTLLASALAVQPAGQDPEEDLLTAAYHMISVLQHFVGVSSGVVGAVLQPPALAATLALPGNVPAQLSVLCLDAVERPWGERRFITEEGYILLRDNSEDELPLIVAQDDDVFPVKVRVPLEVYGYAATQTMEHLLDCVVRDLPERFRFDEAIAALETLEVLQSCLVRHDPEGNTTGAASPPDA